MPTQPTTQAITSRSHHPCHRVFPAFLLILSAFSCGQDAQTGTGLVQSPTLDIALTSPAVLANTTGVVTFQGTITPSAPVNNLEVEFRVKGKVVGKGTGGNFSVKIDTTQKTAKGKAVFKDGKVCLNVVASASLGAAGTLTHCIVSDNTNPVVTLVSPLANSVQIGKILITGDVRDKYLKDVSVSVDGQRMVGYCNEKIVDADKKPLCTLAQCRTKFGSCLGGQGGFQLLIDRGSAQTKVVKLVIEATDLTGHTAKLERSITVIRPPSWDVARTYSPRKPDGTVDPKMGVLNDLQVYDFDQDGVLDTLVCSTTGVWLLRGIAVTKKGKTTGTGRLMPPILVSAAPLIRLVLIDIDGDKKKDIYGIGRLSLTAKDDETGAMAFLTKKGGLKPVAQIKLLGTVVALAAADMDRNGVPDIVVAAKTDINALQVVRAVDPNALICPSKTDAKRLCKDVVNASDLGSATVFGTPDPVTQMTAGISSIVVADFHVSGKDVYPDVAVGRKTVSTLTVCRNVKGKLVDCKDTQKNGYTADLSDISLMVTTDWNLDGKVDLIIASKGAGIVRWLGGEGDGTFSFDPKTSRQQLLNEIESITVGPVGPSGKDYLMIAYGGRTVTFVPTLPDDRSHIDKCYRSWILGGSITTLRYGDLNGDGSVELIGIDRAPHGVAVALSTGDGNYHAATVHRICGLRKGGFQFGTLEVSRFKLGDVSADLKPDLMLVSDAVTSLRSAKSNQCPDKKIKGLLTPQPAHVFHLYVNEGTSLEEAARAGEWGPFTTIGLQKASGVKEIKKGTCGTAMPDLSGLEFGEFSGKQPRDMVLSRKQDYTVGAAPDSETACPFNERNEVANLYGLQEGGSEESPGPLCKNFRDEDEVKKQPLSSARTGAPLKRASVVTFINGDAAAPFGLSTANRPDDPVEMRPHFMFAGGRSPISLVVGQFDKDNIDDIATLMERRGDPSRRDYLPARIRTFRSTSAKEGGIVKPVLYFKQGSGLGAKYNDENKDTAKQPVVVSGQDSWNFIGSRKLIQEQVFVSYLIPGDRPKKMRAARYCKTGPLTSLFTINDVEDAGGSFSIFRAQGNSVVDTPVTYSTGSKISGFGVTDADGDKCTDVLYAKNNQLAFAKGTSTTFLTAKYFFPILFKDLGAVEVFDVNSDGTLDMLLVDRTTSQVFFYLNDGAGNFVPAVVGVPVLPTAGDLQVGDINGDGCTDLAIQGTYGVAVLLSLACK